MALCLGVLVSCGTSAGIAWYVASAVVDGQWSAGSKGRFDANFKPARAGRSLYAQQAALGSHNASFRASTVHSGVPASSGILAARPGMSEPIVRPPASGAQSCARVEVEFTAMVQTFRGPLPVPGQMPAALRRAWPTIQILVVDDSHEQAAAWMGNLTGPWDHYIAAPDLS